MKKILILQGGFNEEHKVSINTANEVAKALNKLKIDFKRLMVNPKTFNTDISKFSKIIYALMLCMDHLVRMVKSKNFKN